jgi:hypothetical protein
MSDAGEGLVDAESRLQEQLDAREHERRRRGAAPVVDPEKHRALESLRLARIELERQVNASTHPVRRQQIDDAMKEIDRRIASAS